MNVRVLNNVSRPATHVACFSVDSVAEVDHQAVYPTEYTNSVDCHHTNSTF